MTVAMIYLTRYKIFAMEEEVMNVPETNHDKIVGRMKSKFPDRDFDGENGQTSLEQSIIEALEASDSEAADYDRLKEDTDRLAQLFNTSPRAAEFLSVLAETRDPAEAIYKAYGREAYEAFAEGSASELITALEAEDAKRIADDEQFENEKEANLKKSFETLDAWGNSKNLTEEQKVEVFMKFYNILGDALLGIYNEDLFEMGWKAAHYDEDVETARHEGEVTGRNEKIKEKARRRRETDAMPPSLSGQGVRVPERTPDVKDDPWMLGV